MALASGNSRKAAEMLASQGLKVGSKTLWRWTNERHGEEYERIRRDVLPRVREHTAELHMELAEREIAMSHELIDRLDKTKGEIPPRDLPGAIRNLDVGSGVHTDKARDLRGDPTVTVEKHSLQETIRGLEDLGLKVKIVHDEVIEGAVDAQVVEELPASDYVP